MGGASGPSPTARPPEPLQRAYAEVSPDGADHFPIVVEKAATAAANQRLDLAKLTELTAPTLLAYGDDDIVSLEHAIALYRAIPNAALAVVADASHLLLHEHSALLLDLVSGFLRHGHPPTLMPIERTP